MKRVFSLLILLAVLLCGCTAQPENRTRTDASQSAAYTPLTEIDHYVTEPDERAVMSESDRSAYRQLMDAVLSRRESVTVSGDQEPAFYLDLLRSSPYGYFLSDVTITGDTFALSYAYSAEEQAQMLAFIDGEFLKIANTDADPEDNELDIILKIYSAVTNRLDYDLEREDNKQLGSDLFDHPADEIYQALKTGKSLCYGFAYLMRFALQQRGIDCFCVYGECRAHEMGHEWILFSYDGAFFHCDPSWDRANGVYPKLRHFGKTDEERVADTLEPRDFSEYHYAAYGTVTCTDERFSIFRDVTHFSYVSPHRFYIETSEGESHIFDTSDFSFHG